MQRDPDGLMMLNGYPIQDIIDRMLNGATGIAKVAVGIDRTDEEMIARRLKTCRACPSGLYSDGICRIDGGGCGCILSMKVRLSGEKCPKGHW